MAKLRRHKAKRAKLGKSMGKTKKSSGGGKGRK